ncbi:MAG: phospholipase [Anaerolineae bacterium]|nr:phospholipase [Anaerolineae bacterium]
MTPKRKRSPALYPFFLVLLLLTACTLLDSGAVSETVGSDWIHVYFTAPRYPDDPADHLGGVDAHLIDLIDVAQTQVDVAAYELDLPGVAEALIRAHQDGVQVRLVTDGSYAGEEAVGQLRAAGVPVVARPEGWGIMHNKFVVVDDTWVWTGSWNLTVNGTYRNNNNAVIVASRALAQDYGAEFEELFSSLFGPSSPAETPYPVINIEGQGQAVQLEVYFAPEDDVSDRLLQLLDDADDSVRFMAFQFTSDPLAQALVDLAGRGVAVQGVVESRSATAPYSQYEYLSANGVAVWTDGNPYNMHHKVLIVDDRIVVLGSYNFTDNADENNDENLLVVHDSQVAAAYLAEFGRVLQQAQSAGP